MHVIQMVRIVVEGGSWVYEYLLHYVSQLNKFLYNTILRIILVVVATQTLYFIAFHPYFTLSTIIKLSKLTTKRKSTLLQPVIILTRCTF